MNKKHEEITIDAIIKVQREVGISLDNFKQDLIDEGFSSREITIAYINCIATLMKNISSLYGAFSAAIFEEEESYNRFREIFKSCYQDVKTSHKANKIKIEAINSTPLSQKFHLSDEEKDEIIEHVRDLLNRS